jgi:hypothetical protein
MKIKEVTYMNKLFVFFTFFTITALSSLAPLNTADLRSQTFDASNRYCEKKIDEGIKLIIENRNGLFTCGVDVKRLQIHHHSEDLNEFQGR